MMCCLLLVRVVAFLLIQAVAAGSASLRKSSNEYVGIELSKQAASVVRTQNDSPHSSLRSLASAAPNASSTIGSSWQSQSRRTAQCPNQKRKRTLQKVQEIKMNKLFSDPKGQTKFEASGIIKVGSSDKLYVVCDNSWAVAEIADLTKPFSSSNVQIGIPNREKFSSGFEGIFEDGGSYYAVRESIKLPGDNQYHAVIEQLVLGTQDYAVNESCSTEFVFEGDSKGLEGLIGVRDLHNELVVLGLCEGNHCSQSRQNDRGNGRLVAMKRNVSEDGLSCLWSTIRVINIPSSANFLDYSDLSLDETTGRIAITTQAGSQMWVGQLLGRQQPGGLWDIDAMEFNSSVGVVYDFPKNKKCETVYCNIEGVQWLDSKTILAASDQRKSSQKSSCAAKDQSVHVFTLP